MNEDMILKIAERQAKNGELSYDQFDALYDFLTKKEQYEVIEILFKNGIELVDEIEKDDENDINITALNSDDVSDIFKDEEDDDYIIVRDEIKQANPILCALIQQGNKQAEQDLCIKNKRLVFKIASKCYKMYNSSLEMEDLVQVGYMGMLKAARKFDLSQGNAFSTYAIWWIKQSIVREIIDHGTTIRIPVHMMDNLYRVLKSERDYSELNTNDRILAISGDLDMPEETVRRCFELKNLTAINSLDKSVGEGESTELIEIVPFEEEEPVDANLIKKSLREEFEKIFMELTDRERKVIKMRFGWDDDVERTLVDIGDSFGVTRERIRQIEVKAIRRILYRAAKRKMKEYLY